MFFAGSHSVELAGEAGDELDEVVDEFFLCGFVRLVFDDGDGDAVVVEKAFEVGEAKAGESVLVGDEDAAVVAVLYVVEELVETAADVCVGGFDRPSVVVSVVSKTVELPIKVAVVFLSVTGDAGVERDVVAGASITSEAEEFTVWDASVAAGRACVVKVAVSTPPFDSFGVDAKFLRELADGVRPWHRVVANHHLLLLKDSEFRNSYEPYGEDNPGIERRLRRSIDTGVDYDVTPITGRWGTEHGVKALEDLFDRPRSTTTEEFDQFEKDLAHTAQKLLEESVTAIVDEYVDRIGTGNVGLAGGVALNCKLNKCVRESPAVDDVFVQPVAHDAGLALGGGWIDYRPDEVDPLTNVYWGPEYETDDVRELLETNKVDYAEPANLERRVAELLADGALVGWFQGRLELGPRALGNRSILADPRTETSRDRVNRFVKHREEWRPFAPSMVESAADEYLENAIASPYMIDTFDVAPEKRDELGAVLHPADDTTRPQTVREEQNPRYYRLLREFETVTGVPVLLNTSFNDHAEPIVTTPTGALKDFFGMGLDVLVLEDVVVTKRDSKFELP